MSKASLEISELFYSIQGESSYAGYPCVFIRLAGCNLRCSYCDARYTYEEPSRTILLSEIMDYVRKQKVGLVEITGGEPLLQDKVYSLMEMLLAEGKTVLLESNGSIDLARVPTGVVKIMDVKCPASGMAEHTELGNLALLSGDDELKFVLSSKDDYLWALDFVRQHVLPAASQAPKILFSPVAQKLSATELADWLLAERLPIRLQLQLHTLLWPEETRGV